MGREGRKKGNNILNKFKDKAHECMVLYYSFRIDKTSDVMSFLTRPLSLVWR